MEYLPRYREEKLFEEIPLFVELNRLGRPDSSSIKKLIDAEIARNMKVKDVIEYCLKSAETPEERTTAGIIQSFIRSSDYHICINQMPNVNPEKLILDYVKGKSRKEIDGREIVCHYANILISPAGELR